MKTKNDVTIGQALDKMISEFGLKNKLDESRIVEMWAGLLGKTIARYTSAISLKDGKLYIKVESAPLKQELNYSREKIKDLFNKELAGPVVKDVVIY
jgi:predicted nucleic acid-binding Zn ribbon protein